MICHAIQLSGPVFFIAGIKDSSLIAIPGPVPLVSETLCLFDKLRPVNKASKTTLADK